MFHLILVGITSSLLESVKRNEGGRGLLSRQYPLKHDESYLIVPKARVTL